MTLDVAKRGFLLSFSFTDEAMLREHAAKAAEHGDEQDDAEAYLLFLFIYSFATLLSAPRKATT